MRLILQTANVASDAKNCVYPNRVEVTSASEMKEAVKYDHVCGEFKGNYRSVSNFIRSNVLVMDCDNDHSEDPEDWITPEKMDEMMPDVSYAIAPSRNHMKEKDGRTPRPKFHIYFEIEPTEDAKYYADLKRSIQSKYPFFDGNALDAARFIFGADSGEVIWHEGWESIDELPMEDDFDAGMSDGSQIPEGCRNNAMSRFAGRILKRYGNTEKAYQAYLDYANRCDPPLADEELETIWKSAQRFYQKTVVSQDGYVPPDEYNEKYVGYLRPDEFTDMDEAKLLIREYGEELRYSEATEYIRYDGKCWIEDAQLAMGAVLEFMDLQMKDANDSMDAAKKALIKAGADRADVERGSKAVAKNAPPALIPLVNKLASAEEYRKFVLGRRDFKRINSTYNTAKPMTVIDVSTLDANENLLNTPTGTYDLRKGLDGEKEHDPHDFITRITSCSPSDEGKQIWLDALDVFFCKDPEVIDYVQMVIGMAAIGKVYQEHMIIAYGDGANGKSTFWNTIFRVMGTYAGKLSAESLTMKCKRNIMPELAEMKGKRLIISSEMQEGMRLNTSVVKQLCSTDEIQAEKKFKAPFHFIPSHTLVLYTNHLPKVGANDNGIWRRLVVIPFNAKIEGNSDIKNYADYLYQNAGGYIMKWIIEGAGKAIEKDFRIPLPKLVQDAINQYREDNNWMGQFLDECCDIGADLTEKSGELYQAYRSYCIRSGEYTRSTSDFYTTLESSGFIKKKTKKGMIVYGLKLKEEQDFL